MFSIEIDSEGEWCAEGHTDTTRRGISLQIPAAQRSWVVSLPLPLTQGRSSPNWVGAAASSGPEHPHFSSLSTHSVPACHSFCCCQKPLLSSLTSLWLFWVLPGRDHQVSTSCGSHTWPRAVMYTGSSTNLSRQL